MINEKTVHYTSINTYSTLNSITPKTKNIWIVCHGLGYLSKYFIKYFKGLNSEENFIIAPQAPSTYYQDKSFKYVGANWLTKVDTEKGIENILHYLDAVYKAEVKEQLTSNRNLILLGYSQGVSVITRWVALRKVHCHKLILHSGGLPQELNPSDFSHLINTQVNIIYGTQDEYLDEERLKQETSKAKNLFNRDLTVKSFEGKHEVNTQLIYEIINE